MSVSLLRELISAESLIDVRRALENTEKPAGLVHEWSPLGGRRNNRGTVEVSSDPGRALIERVTNAVDAVLEYEFARHGGRPDCRSPSEAAEAWLGVPPAGLSAMTPAQRRTLAKRVTVALKPGDGRSLRVLEIRDLGTGIIPSQMPQTILSLNESNKVEKLHLSGAYGQGGSATYAVSRYTLIASRRKGSPVGFTLVRFDEPPPDAPKEGRYVYLVQHTGAVFEAELSEAEFAQGTLIRHFGYDLSDYPSPLGPNSLYGLLNQVLFDPVMPIWLDNTVNGYRRVIKGARNALNGAVDEGDETSSGPNLSHNVPMFYVDLGDFGRIGVEYWVLDAPNKKNKRPSAAFVDPNKPVILTYNGQNQAELGVGLIRKEAELPHLSQRLIMHVQCNALTFAAQRALFVSNREAARKGAVLQAIHAEVLRVLQSDDELERLNAAARDAARREHDEDAVKQMRREVARLLRMQGLSVRLPGGGGGSGGGSDKPRTPRPPRPPMPPIPPVEPPTFIRVVWPEDKPLDFYPGQRRYVRVETDANSTWHNVLNALDSRFNFVVSSDSIVLKGTTPLKGGRLRAILECSEGVRIGTSGSFRVELRRPGLSTLADERVTVTVPPPAPKPGRSSLEVPPFDWRPVDGPDDPTWGSLGWPDDFGSVAYEATMEDGTLMIHYSTVFPRFADRRRALENSGQSVSASFQRRYEIWLAVHALLLHSDEARIASKELDEDVAAARDHAERARVGAMCVLVAAQEASDSSAIDASVIDA